MYIHTYKHTYIHTYKNTYKHTYIVYNSTYMYMYMYMFIYVQTDIQFNTFTKSLGHPLPKTLLLPNPWLLPPYSATLVEEGLSPAYTNTWNEELNGWMNGWIDG